ncbi:hypothetical protein DFW101_2257 [Solidesulfovibrio carbinoliphilus subsp. oakridgensis]|uniref:Phage holin family protein n=1 Tax=Solidesulfovibrio carbinoliphilus subsp. oakridgensis TaxID=694327 RepID=G7QAB1_9BACT|nr:phage holin family protein [Solidesulfovibrio carbinoliphilus]EHJ48262.1 hypothetical protein DFW101_2257 [Solidesulfovibrio carbinoliphilus subsp. oakridgensis]
MMRISGAFDETVASGGRVLGLAAELLAGRLELLGLEAREAKIRLLQFLILACLGAVFLAVGLALAVLAVLLAVPPAWRLPAVAGGAGVCLVVAWAALWSLRRRVARLPLAFAQTIGELKKDGECF